MIITDYAKGYHVHNDLESIYAQLRNSDSGDWKTISIVEREVSYRFLLHQHPYVGQLVQRLLRKGVGGLQATDTEYAPNNAALAGSVELALAGSTNLSLPAGSTIALLGDVDVTVPGSPPFGLASSMRLRLHSAAPASLAAGTHCTLEEGLSNAAEVGAAFNLPRAMQASIYADGRAILTSSSSLALPDGRVGQIAAGAEVLLVRGSVVTLPTGAGARMIRLKRLPLELFASLFSPTHYNPSALVARPYPVKDLDFTSGGAYAVYNWELFFHVPFTIAIHLSKNQRFAEAQRWFHYLFDPTDDSDGPTPERFWKVRPFQYTDVKKIEEILVNLAAGGDETLRNETIQSIEAWKSNPFRPHVIARYRQQAYMYKTVMAYLDNLIAWGDSLFRQDTGEAIDEALMLYVLAANILGPRPQAVPTKGSLRPQTYHSLRSDLRQFGTVMRDVEADLPFDLMPFPADDSGDNDQLTMVRSLGQALYFCVPRNDKLLSYWDTVADRLFKIRNSLNLQGVFRQLALFEPPIDPAMLARAVAAGLDIGAVVNGLNQPLSTVRFQLLAQRAVELAQEVKTLGGNLLAAMEKEDNEAMALLRAKHERAVMDMVELVKYGQLQEASKAREGLLQSLAIAVERYTFYERQLGRQPEAIQQAIPQLDELDKQSLARMKFKAEEPSLALRAIEVDIATDLFAQVAQALNGGKLLSSYEVRETLLLEGGQLATDIANILSVAGSIAHIVPTVKVHAQPVGVGGTAEFGGSNIGHALGAGASAARAIAERVNFEARRASRIDSFARRERDWAFQSNLAASEIGQIFKQLRAAQLREAVAEQELENHRKQKEHAQQVVQFLNEEGVERQGKKTSKAFYTWVKREAKGLYAQAFQLAFEVARKAERALQHELGNQELRFLDAGYLAGKEGLLAGEKLFFDLKRMELAYQELNQREYELTRHASLLQLSPLALVQLRATGRCTLRLPEELFDMDGPGHYFRRIKTVALSIPCVVGPYTGVHCKLTLLKSSIRKTPVVGDEYGRSGTEDERFSDSFASLQSVVVSSAQNDSGLFETNLRDERYLPFELAGAISEWQLELPGDPSKGDPVQFDYATISDVILHVRYTAREGGGLLREGALANLSARIEAADSVGSVRLFSLRHEFPSEWARFRAETPTATTPARLAFTLRDEHYPLWSKGRLTRVSRVDILARSAADVPPPNLVVANAADDDPDEAAKDTLVRTAALGGLLVGRLNAIPLPAHPTESIELFFSASNLADLWVAVTWGG